MAIATILMSLQIANGMYYYITKLENSSTLIILTFIRKPITVLLMSFADRSGRHSTAQLVESGTVEPEYMSIPSESPSPARHQLPLPHTGNHYEGSLRSSTGDDSTKDSEYGLRSVKIRTL